MKSFWEKIAAAFRRFPARVVETARRFSGTVALLLLFYLLLDLDAYTQIPVDERLLWLLPPGAVALLAADVFFAARKPRLYVNWGVKLALLLLLALAYPSLERYNLRIPLLYAAALALFGLTVCLAYRERSEETLGVLIVRGAASVLFALVLYIGFWLILWGMDLLLFSVHHDVYSELARFCFLLFAPLMFLSGIPRPGEEKSLLRGYQQLLRIVVLPLLVVFMLVLYCYYIKLLLTADLPISELGGVSLVFLCINLPMLILAKPFCQGGWSKLRAVLLYGTLPVFAALFFTAVRQMLLYGVSVTRYIVLIGGLALLLCVFFMVFKKGKYQPAVFAVLLAAALLTSYGPQSCYSLTRLSQHARLTAVLTEAGILRDGALTPNPDADPALQREILGLYRYCHYENLGLPDYFPNVTARGIITVFGFDDSTLPETEDTRWYHYPEGAPVSLGGGRYYLPGRYGSYRLDADWGELEVQLDEGLRITCNGERLAEVSEDEMASVVRGAILSHDAPESYVYTAEVPGRFSLRVPFEYIADGEKVSGDWFGVFLTITGE